MTKGDSSTKRVNLGTLKTQDLRVRQNNSCERLIEFPDSDLVLSDACTLKSQRHGLGWGHREIDGIHSCVGVAADASKDAGVRTVFLSEGAVTENESAGAVVEGGGVGGGDGACAVTYEGRLEGGDLLELDVEVSLIGVDDLVALAGSDSHRGDLVCESLVRPCSLGV